MIRVLHVDDEVEFLDLVSFFLKREGDFEVDTTTTAESALEKMKSENYDAAVVDYSLPGMDGIELLKILRAKGLRIPFVLFTGKGKEETAVQALNCGADFYLQKGAGTQLQFTELANMLRKSVQSNRSDAAAREGERFLSSVFSSIQDGISVLDKDLNILRVNQTMENWYSHKMPLVGKKCYDAYHGRRAQCDSCPSIRTIESGKSAYEVVPKTGPEGDIMGWLDLYSFPMRDSKTGELSGVIEYVRDITDRRKAEVELHGALERYKDLQGIIDKSPVIMVIWRPEPGSPVSFISDSVAQWGYRRDDFVSTLVYDDIIHKEDLEREKEEFRDFVRKGVDDFVQEYRIVTKSGEVRFVEDHTYVRRDSDGNPVLYEGIVIDVTARKIAQQNSEELTSRLQAIVEAFPDLYFHVDAHGTILDFNAGRIADLYVPPQKFLGRKMQEVLPPDVRKMYGSAFGKALKTGRVVPMEYSLEIEGETRFFEARLAPMTNDQILIVVRNITERKQVADALRESEERYRKLVESMLEGVAYCRMLYDGRGHPVDWIYLNVNSNFETLTGLHHIVGKRVTEAIPGIEKSNPELFEIYGRVASSGKPEVFESEIKPLRQWLKISVFCPEKDHFVAVFEDITERKKSEVVIAESLEKRRELESIIDKSPAIAFIWKHDPEWSVVFVSSNIKQFGYMPEDFTSKRLAYADLVHPEDLKRVFGESEAYAKKGVSEFTQEYRILTKSGDVRWVDDRSVVLRNTTGESVLHQGIIFDITEQRRVERALRQANKKLALLGSITRHDAINQLSVLMAWLDIAKEVGKDLPTMEHLTRMQESARILQGQLEFTAEYQEMGIKQPQWMSLRDAADAGTEGIDLGAVSIKYDLKGAEVFADPMLEKVFHNLVDNSLRHGEKVTQIRIYCKESHEGLVIICEDDGVGIPVDEKESIFEHGFGKHTGLGLYLVREVLGITGIVVKEAGEPGTGARFEMLVPAGNYRIGHSGQ